MNSKALAYRPDIDGLRALAVLFVLLFHAFPSLLPGGFVGVDVFFVISGYLITGLILRDLESGQFSLRHFYARRVRRIFPALCLVMAVSLGYGWLVLTAGEYQQLGRHVASGAAFLANFMFWREAGYFDNAADTKPMLHLWSLGIEEQFYMVWPPLLWLWWRRWRALSWLVIPLAGLSLGYSLHLAGRDLVADFYSPLTRFWELLLGAWLVYMARSGRLGGGFWRSVAAPLGLLLVLLSLVWVHQGLAFPGGWALLPAVGAALLLGAGMQAGLNQHLLASPALVWLGLISYPLYLWHWPLLSMARIVASQTPAAEVRALLLVLSVLLAWLTYRYLERPIRFGSQRRWAVPVLCLCMVLLFTAGHNINRQHGLQFRHHDLLNADPASMVIGADRARLKPECLLGNAKQLGLDWCFSDGRPAPNYVLLGDSKGEALFYGLVRESGPEMAGSMVGQVNLLWGPAAPSNQAVYAAIEQNPGIRQIFLVNALRGIFPLDPETGFIAGLVTEAMIDDKVLRYTEAIAPWLAAGRRVVFVKDNPTLPDPDSCISGGMTHHDFLNRFFFRHENQRCQLRLSEHLSGTQAYQSLVEKLQIANPALQVFDPLPLLCDVPKNLCTVAYQRQFLYSYGDHISDFSSSRIAQELILRHPHPAARGGH